MHEDDPEERIAELERELAAQRRIAELERQLAEAKATAGENYAQEQPAQNFAAPTGTGQDRPDEHARRYAEALLEGLRRGGTPVPDGPSGPEMAGLREALKRAAAGAGMSEAQINDALQHATITVKSGHAVVYPEHGGARDFGGQSGFAPAPAFPREAAFISQGQGDLGRQQPRRTRYEAVDFGRIVGWMGGAIGVCVGGAAALTALLPSSALWTSVILCGGPNQLMSNTSHYSYGPGSSGSNVSFQCVDVDGAYDVNFFAIMGLQSLLIALVVGAAVAARGLIRRLLRRKPMPIWNAVIVGILVPLAAAAVVTTQWPALTSSNSVQMAKGGALTVKGNGESKTVACNDGYLTVDGRDMTVTVTGHCAQLTVKAIISHVTVDSTDAIKVDGLKNVIIFHSGSPDVTVNSGGNNTIQQG
jgi:hypothetical protein